jgi:tripartite-type tricarboxylate transporter receptor subunit TctC
MGEKAVPGFQVSTWYGLYAPKGTPGEAITKLYSAYQRVMQDKSFTKTMSDQGILLLPEADYSPKHFQQHTIDEGKRWAEVIKQAGIKLN